MAALLYKEFTAIRGRWLIFFLLGVTALLSAAELFLPEDALYALYIMVPSLSITSMIVIFTNLFYRVAECESRRRQKAFLFAAPISKKTYIASKYCFVLILFYVMYSCIILWTMLVMITPPAPETAENINGLYALITPLVYTCIFFTAFEFPLILLFGKKKSGLIRLSVGTVLAMIALICLFFGDITVLDRCGDFLIYLAKHQALIFTIEFLSSLIALAAYYISYRVTVYFYDKEDFYEED